MYKRCKYSIYGKFKCKKITEKFISEKKEFKFWCPNINSDKKKFSNFYIIRGRDGCSMMRPPKNRKIYDWQRKQFFLVSGSYEEKEIKLNAFNDIYSSIEYTMYFHNFFQNYEIYKKYFEENYKQDPLSYEEYTAFIPWYKHWLKIKYNINYNPKEGSSYKGRTNPRRVTFSEDGSQTIFNLDDENKMIGETQREKIKELEFDI